MQYRQVNSEAGIGEIYVPTAAEKTINALRPRGVLYGRPGWGSTTDANGRLVLVDRARGQRMVRASSSEPSLIGSGVGRALRFTNTATQSMVSEDGVDEITNGDVYTLAFLVRQTSGTFGGAPFGFAGAPATDIAYPWFDRTTGGLTYFSRGQSTNVPASGTAQNDGVWNTFIISIDITQTTPANRVAFYKELTPLALNSQVPVAMSAVAGARQPTLGGAGPAGATDTFNGDFGGKLSLSGVAVHTDANGAALRAAIVSYFAEIKATL